MPTQIQRRYVSLSDAATYTGLTERYLTDAIKSGRLKAYRVNPDRPQSRYVRFLAYTGLRAAELAGLDAAEAV